MTRIWNWGYLVLALVAVLTFGACSAASSRSLSTLSTEPQPTRLTQPSSQPRTTTAEQSQGLNLRVSSPADNARLHANLIPVNGWVSDPMALVLVNNVTATVDANGNYAGYALINEGENIVEVKASDGSAAAARTVHVNFAPALVAHLDYPDGLGGDFNYREKPVTVTGRVNKPEAKVTVNGEEVTVAPDETFTAEVWLKQNAGSGARIIAQAALEEERDEDYYLFFLAENGGVGPVPGYSIFKRANLSTKPALTISRGETERVSVTLRTNRDGPGRFSSSAVYVGPKPNTRPTGFVPGLDARLEPAEFVAYPATVYQFDVVVTVGEDVPAGTYELGFSAELKGSDGELITRWSPRSEITVQ